MVGGANRCPANLSGSCYAVGNRVNQFRRELATSPSRFDSPETFLQRGCGRLNLLRERCGFRSV